MMENLPRRVASAVQALTLTLALQTKSLKALWTLDQRLLLHRSSLATDLCVQDAGDDACDAALSASSTKQR
jgi:hypothetical protein